MSKDKRKLRRENTLEISFHNVDVGPTNAACPDSAKNLFGSK
jgi:hypothetical protein